MENGILEQHKSYVGKPVVEVPSPAFIINQSVLQKNIDTLHNDVAQLGIRFRPHVKTLKSLEVTRLMLQEGKHRGIVASTLPEIKGSIPLAQEGLLDECLYSLPVYPGVLPQLVDLRKHMNILLMVDNMQQIDLLEKFSREMPNAPDKWDVFIKIDVGSHRAGIENHVPRLKSLVERAEQSPVVSIYGFYCHAGHSYSCKTADEAEKVLRSEIDGVVEAAKNMSQERPVIVSVGATPTAHVIQSMKATLPSHMTLELHAGNFPANDLQQVSTGLVDTSQQAIRILTEVCSIYPERNEALVNAGVIAMSREASSMFPGFGTVADKLEWSVVRMSQEHGIIGQSNASNKDARTIEDDFAVGNKVFLYCQHTCITAAAFPAYYVVDERDVVRDVWIPWKFW